MQRHCLPRARDWLRACGAVAMLLAIVLKGAAACTPVAYRFAILQGPSALAAGIIKAFGRYIYKGLALLGAFVEVGLYLFQRRRIIGHRGSFFAV